MGKAKATSRKRATARDLTVRKAKTVKAGTLGTASAFIPGAGVISAATSNPK